jgi:hypothetical protein
MLSHSVFGRFSFRFSNTNTAVYYSETLRICWCGALSLTRGRICSLKLLLALASAVILGYRVSWDSRPYFTVSDLRLLFSSLLTTRRATVEVLDPASTQDTWPHCSNCPSYSRHGPHRKHRSSIVAFVSVAAGTCLLLCFPETGCVTPFIKKLLT